MGMGGVSHCFPINANLQDPSIFSIEGVTQTYSQTLQQIQLAGPTFFAPLLQEFLRMMEARRG